MQDNIKKILEKIKQLESELLDEIEALQDEFSYTVLEKKIHFAADELKQHKQHVLKLRHRLSGSLLSCLWHSQG